MFIYLAGTGLSLGLSSFTIISIERYLCIFYALRWQELLTNGRVVAVVVGVWMIWLPTFSSLYGFTLWGAFYYVYVLSLIINVLALLVTNGRILKEVRRHEISIAQVSHGAPNAEELRKAREKKRAKTIIVMLALVFLCYGPTIILIFVSKIPSVDQVDLQFGWMACRTISLSHSSFAILVYGLRTKEIRSAYKDIMNKLRCCLH
jgi:heme exporter protein D